MTNPIWTARWRFAAVMQFRCIASGPAPFGRREASIKYVDRSQYDQTPQWVSVRQGPESFMPELVKIGEEGDAPLVRGSVDGEKIRPFIDNA